MAVKLSPDSAAPAVSAELPIMKPLDDFDLTEVEAATPRDVDPILASQGFKDLIDEARAILSRELPGGKFEIVQLTGAICHDGSVHRPGIWFFVREKNATGREMSPESRTRVAAAAEAVQAELKLS